MRRLKNLMPELAMLMPAIVLLTIFVVVPFFMSGYLSFTNEKLIARPIATIWVGWRNYERLFTDPVFWQAVKTRFTLPCWLPHSSWQFHWVQRCY